MRRRSERKKSTDCSSPAPPPASSRRTSRRSRKSPSMSETEKVDTSEPQQAEQERNEEADHGRDSSEERQEPVRKSRNSRNHTPVIESPGKRKNRRTSVAADTKIDAIPEEENGSATIAEENEAAAAGGVEFVKVKESSVVRNEVQDEGTQSTVEEEESTPSPKADTDDNQQQAGDVLEIEAEDKDKVEPSTGATLVEAGTVVGPAEEIEDKSIVDAVVSETSTDAEPNKDDDKKEQGTPEIHSHEVVLAVDEVEESSTSPDLQKSQVNNATPNLTEIARTRKRRWLTKKCSESKAPIVSISSDSLKNLIADVHPVPLSDIQLDSSSEVEEVVSEREEGEETPSPEREPDREHERRRVSIDKPDKASSAKRSQNETVSIVTENITRTIVQHSPSPARNQASRVLYITNLVRPFTVLQLKGLLARTGKIVENGFWIDRIKSKCYVQYETEDESSETRHALHGVRWPVSNPKCLNVDFGQKADMDRAIQSTKDEAPKFGHDNNKDNLIIGTGWNRDQNEVDDKKGSRPVREWDVGKKDSLDRDKIRDLDKRRSRERDISGNRENLKNDKDRKNRAKGRDPRSRSISPVRKIKKKENDPPLRLLDDLFRKTKATPCIYWLPLTPEQIAEKEAFRQKRIEEHKQRIKQRELERGKEREKERTRGSDRDRRNRSSRSRDRRRY